MEDSGLLRVLFLHDIINYHTTMRTAMNVHKCTLSHNTYYVTVSDTHTCTQSVTYWKKGLKSPLLIFFYFSSYVLYNKSIETSQLGLRSNTDSNRWSTLIVMMTKQWQKWMYNTRIIQNVTYYTLRTFSTCHVHTNTHTTHKHILQYMIGIYIQLLILQVLCYDFPT